MNKWIAGILGIGAIVIVGGIAYYYLTRPKESTVYAIYPPPPPPHLEPEVILVPVTEIRDESITKDIKETEEHPYPCTDPVTHDETTCYKKNGTEYIINYNGEEEKLIRA